MKRSNFLFFALALLCSGTAHITVQAQHATAQAQATVELRNTSFRVAIDPDTGAMTSIVHPDDPAQMSWIGSGANAPWQPTGSAWGLGFADLGPATLHRARWGKPISIVRSDPNLVTVAYRVGDLQVEVRRELKGAALDERYSFTNMGAEPLSLRRASKAALAIYTPFNDHYTSSADVLENRAHAHIWAGGSSAWVTMLRMGGRAPHLGLALTEGAIDGYSIEDRDQITLSNTRGSFPSASGHRDACAWRDAGGGLDALLAWGLGRLLRPGAPAITADGPDRCVQLDRAPGRTGHDDLRR